jgi:hypothetical protein
MKHSGTRQRRPARPGIPSSRAVSAGGGRCWVRTNVGLADGFTAAHSCSPGCPLTCGYSIPRQVKTARCPCGVRSFRVCLVSATHLLDQVPGRPTESYCIQLSPLPPCHPPLPGRARTEVRGLPRPMTAASVPVGTSCCTGEPGPVTVLVTADQPCHCLLFGEAPHGPRASAM